MQHYDVIETYKTNIPGICCFANPSKNGTSTLYSVHEGWSNGGSFLNLYQYLLHITTTFWIKDLYLPCREIDLSDEIITRKYTYWHHKPTGKNEREDARQEVYLQTETSQARGNWKDYCIIEKNPNLQVEMLSILG